MLGSVDSLTIVCSYPRLQIEDIKELNFTAKRGRFGSLSWFDNGLPGIHEPQLTFYPTWRKIYRLRVDLNIPKLYYGSNILLPNSADIREIFPLVSNNVEVRTGQKFDAFRADTCRIHYAFNRVSEIDEVKRVIAHYAGFDVPRMRKTVINDETVYFQNKSRGMRIYDKNAETIINDPRPELIEQSNRITRFEYFFDELTNIKRFAKRMGFKNSSAGVMLSENSINAAIKEFQTLLKYENLNLTNQNKVGLIYRQTKDIKKAIQLSGFLDAVEYFGKDFYRNREFKMGKTTYYNHLRECQKLGL